jgi:hypothetical protein
MWVSLIHSTIIESIGNQTRQLVLPLVVADTQENAMNALNHFFAFAVLLLIACRVSGAETVLRPITDADGVLAVYTEDWGLGSSSLQPRLTLAVWKDGYVVWSEDRLHGGAPYHAGRIDPKRLDSTLSDLERDGLFAEKSLARSNFGPDSSFTTILIRSGKKKIEMRSWHELYESEGKVVAAVHGLTGLGNQSLFQALKEQPSDYLLFRLVWNDIRARAAGLIPSAGKPVNGETVMEYRILSWREMPAANEQSR